MGLRKQPKMPVPLGANHSIKIETKIPKSKMEALQSLYHDSCALYGKLKALAPHIDSYNSMSLPTEDMLTEVEQMCYEFGALISVHKSVVAKKSN